MSQFNFNPDTQGLDLSPFVHPLILSLKKAMNWDSLDKRNFLFFLNEVHPVDINDSLIGALIKPSSWRAMAKMAGVARQKDALARSIHRVQLYIHVPFCGQLCTFCHCRRVSLRRRSDMDAYITALVRQMGLLAPVYKGMDASSICFGGGTPSMLDERQLTVLLDGVDQDIPFPQAQNLFRDPSFFVDSLQTGGIIRPGTFPFECRGTVVG